MGKAIQQRMANFSRGDWVAVTLGKARPTKARVLDVERAAMRIEFEHSGLKQRVRMNDVVLWSEYEQGKAHPRSPDQVTLPDAGEREPVVALLRVAETGVVGPRGTGGGIQVHDGKIPVSALPVQLSGWLANYATRHDLSGVAFAKRLGIPLARYVSIKLRNTAAEDDELLAVAAYLERTADPADRGVDWLERVRAMRDADVAAGVRYRSRKMINRRSPGRKAPEVTSAPQEPVEKATAPIPAPEPTPAPTQALATVTATVNGVSVTTDPATLRLLLGLG